MSLHKNKIAAVVMEPIRNIEPENGFWECIQSEANKNNIPLIIDEISAGWRLNLGGAHLLYKIKPDIAVFAKGMSNGYPMAAIIGNRKYMDSAQDSFISSTYWTERIGPTAALATKKKMEQKKVQEHFIKTGKIVQDGWRSIAKKINLSTPKKIAIGMGIAASAFAVMAIGSYGLPTNAARINMGGLNDAVRVTPWLLIGTYLILTIAELFISPLGIAFVSKVAPPQYQGIMQGLWLTATALGNQLLFIGVIFYKSIPIWGTWCIFVAACVISMFTMLFMIKWLERVAK
jgi:acetylornithine/succinyldiaminopimelate/putrescine aminotransferase